MDAMVVTLAVLKLSGWLNASAYCPAKRRAFTVGGMCAGRRERVGWWRCKERAGEGLKGDHEVRGTGGASHSKHARHGGDTGRFEVQHLVERSRVLPSQKNGIQGACGLGAGTCRRRCGGEGGGGRERVERT